MSRLGLVTPLSEETGDLLDGARPVDVEVVPDEDHAWPEMASEVAEKGDVLRYIDKLDDVDIVIKHGIRYK